MIREDYDAYTMRIIDEQHDMPFLAGGYTQADWDLLIKGYTDWEDYDHRWESCKSLEEQYDFLTEECLSTKPYWA